MEIYGFLDLVKIKEDTGSIVEQYKRYFLDICYLKGGDNQGYWMYMTDLNNHVISVIFDAVNCSSEYLV